VAAAEDPGSDLAPAARRRIKDAAEYLEVAPRVVAVARDIDLGNPDLTLPRTPRNADRVVELAERWGLNSPAARLVDALSGRG
jgi:hypothetical protein